MRISDWSSDVCSSDLGGGGPCEAWWKGTRGVSCPLYVTRLRPCPSTTFGGPPPRSGEDRPLSVVFCRPEAALQQLQTPHHQRLARGAFGHHREPLVAARRAQIGRASCRARVCQYV